jgi:hypothetical protein
MGYYGYTQSDLDKIALRQINAPEKNLRLSDSRE